MDILRFTGAALLVTVVFAVVRTWNPSFDMPLKLSAAILFLGAIAVSAGPLYEELIGLCEESAFGDRLGTLSAAVGIGILTGVVAEICRECRENAIAGYVELAGRVAILFLCLPLVREILGAVEDLL